MRRNRFLEPLLVLGLAAGLSAAGCARGNPDPRPDGESSRTDAGRRRKDPGDDLVGRSQGRVPDRAATTSRSCRSRTRSRTSRRPPRSIRASPGPSSPSRTRRRPGRSSSSTSTRPSAWPTRPRRERSFSSSPPRRARTPTRRSKRSTWTRSSRRTRTTSGPTSTWAATTSASRNTLRRSSSTGRRRSSSRATRRPTTCSATPTARPANYADAEKAFQKYIELIPKDPNPYDSYAELLLKMGRFDDSSSSTARRWRSTPTS